jgi:hypothetical protein
MYPTMQIQGVLTKVPADRLSKKCLPIAFLK